MLKQPGVKKAGIQAEEKRGQISLGKATRKKQSKDERRWC